MDNTFDIEIEDSKDYFILWVTTPSGLSFKSLIYRLTSSPRNTTLLIFEVLYYVKRYNKTLKSPN